MKRQKIIAWKVQKFPARLLSAESGWGVFLPLENTKKEY